MPPDPEKMRKAIFLASCHRIYLQYQRHNQAHFEQDAGPLPADLGKPTLPYPLNIVKSSRVPFIHPTLHLGNVYPIGCRRSRLHCAF